MENLNRVLLENVLPAHVAEHFLGRNWKNEASLTTLTLSCLHSLFTCYSQQPNCPLHTYRISRFMAGFFFFLRMNKTDEMVYAKRGHYSAFLPKTLK